jgi:hypothetical protein
MAEVQTDGERNKKTPRKGSPKNAVKMRTRMFSRSPPDSPTRGVFHRDATIQAYTADPRLENQQVAQEDNFAGRLSPFKVDGRSTNASPIGTGGVAGYTAVQAPAPEFLPPPPSTWMGAPNFAIAPSYQPENVGFLSTQLKLLLKVQG